jgi:hypothetical protein
MTNLGDLATSNTVSIRDDFLDQYFDVFRHGELYFQAAEQHASGGLTRAQALEYEAFAVDN